MLVLILYLAVASAANSTGRVVFGGDLKSSADLLTLFRYPHEEHDVLTLDGYVLQLDRVPNPGRPPVYMGTPFVSSASVYLTLGPGYAMALRLYDAGYDVWIGNVRGTSFSRDHLRLSPEDDEYWRFSWHEHGVYDHPACIDAVLAKTGRSQLLYVGYSMGATAFFVMASTRPEYNRRVRAAFLMAPAAALGHSRNRLINIAKNSHNVSEAITNWLLPAMPVGLFREMEQTYCRGQLRVNCNKLVDFLFDGTDNEDYIGSTYHFAETFPDGGSFATLWHYAQQAWTKDTFRPYNFDVGTNLRLYGSPLPPNYPLHRITAPIYTYTSTGDTIIHPRDFDFLRRNLRSLVKHFVIPDAKFGHAHYVFSRKSRPVVDKLLQDLDAAGGGGNYNEMGQSL